MPNPNSTRLLATFAACLLLPVATTAAQDKPAAGKKLYCWNQDGQRVCGDSLPPEAMAGAREEINAASGSHAGSVEGMLTDEERAARAQEEARLRSEALAAETRRRTEQAMLTTYQDEDELRRVFNERIALADNSIKTARYNVASLREGLVILLRTAGERELAGKPVPEKLAGDIRQRHAQLLRHQLLERGFEEQRAALDVEIDQTLVRFRELKSLDPSGHAAAGTRQ